jgi:hypothetical protein
MATTTTTNNNSNQIRAAVLLMDASANLNASIINCRILIDSIINLPRGSNTTKELNRLSIQLNYIQTVGHIIRDRITPFIQLGNSNTSYLHNRLKAANKSTNRCIPASMNTTLITPPSLPTHLLISPSSPISSSSSNSSSKKRPYLKQPKAKNKLRRKLPLRLTKTSTDLPIPVNGFQFEVQEAIDVYKKYKGMKYNMVREWIKLKHIPCGESRFFHLLKEEKEGRLDPSSTSWHGDKGRQPILSLQQVEDLIFINKSESAGKCSSVNDIERTLNEERKKQLCEKGLSNVGHTNVCRRTVRNYRSIVGLSKEAKIVKKVQQKTEQRFTAESSLLSTLSYLMTVACTHLFVGDRDEYIHTHSIMDGTEGARRLYNLVSQCNGNAPLKHALPALITSTDDTTMFVFKGTAPNVESWHVVPVVDQKKGKIISHTTATM